MQFLILIAALFASIVTMNPASAVVREFTDVQIIIGDKAGETEKAVAELLRERLNGPSKIPCLVVPESEGAVAPAKDQLLVRIGLADNHDRLAQDLESHRVEPLTELDPGLEGFVVHCLASGDGLTVLAVGIDPRGVLYAAGEILREAVIGVTTIGFPDDLSVRTAPAFEIRGTQYGQGGVMMRLAGTRPWTQNETETAIADDALSGANTVSIDESVTPDDPTYRFVKSLGLKTLAQICPNAGSGPADWQATESIGRTNYLCPSHPLGRKALIEQTEGRFRTNAFIDYIRFNAGDGGGCECDLCKPYGRTFMHLSEELSAVIHKYHPETQIFVANQKLNNEDDMEIFKYLQAEPRKWVRAFCYGPGSDAMMWQPGHRQTHRMDLFHYPGFGPPDRYLNEILHELPPDQDIVFYNELTHWQYSQWGYARHYPRPDIRGDSPPHWGHWIYERRPDPYIAMVHDRLTFFAWPRYFHRVFGETIRYGIGDITHSSHHQDHFNQWMWQRLLWNPHRSVEDIVAEYARTWFGPVAAPQMAEAIFQLETNLEAPVETNPGIDHFYSLVKQAGWSIPDHLMERDWLWRLFMEKAALDKYVQLRVQNQMAIQERVEQLVGRALDAGDSLPESIAKALKEIASEGETKRMADLRAEAMKLGDEGNRIFGMRHTGTFNLEHDYIGLGWTKRQLERASAVDSPTREELLRMITDYENPGEGGYYDDAGSLDRAPRMVSGYPFDHGQPFWGEALAEGNRSSQRSLANTQDEAEGVAFRYEELDPNARYSVRVTLVRPRYQDRYKDRMPQKTQSIFADDAVLVEELELPDHMSDHFEFELPAETTSDGEVTVKFKKGKGIADWPRTQTEIWRNTGGWGTLVSEIWLIKQPS